MVILMMMSMPPPPFPERPRRRRSRHQGGRAERVSGLHGQTPIPNLQLICPPRAVSELAAD